MNDTILNRIEYIRSWLTENDYDAFILPHEDEFLGEYLPSHNERLLWATGFTGSAGAAVITKSKASIFVDGRYTVQVAKQVPSDIYEYQHLIERPPLKWISDNLIAGAKIAFDPKMHSGSWLKQANNKLAEFELVAVEKNPVDHFWNDRPPATYSDVMLMDVSKAGISSVEKRDQIAKQLVSDKADAAIITQLDSICWILNIRGLDVSRLPVILSHAIVYADSSIDFFVESSRLPDEFENHVGSNVRVKDPETLEAALQNLKGKSVLVDPLSSNAWISLCLINAEANIINAQDPCALPKAQKNKAEIKGMTDCHIRDGVAMSKFLCWLDAEVGLGHLHNEATLAKTLEAFRREDDSLVDLSFDTISAATTNAAMCHYNHENQPEPGKLEMNSLYLVDSGGQYLDGTTDITRTVAIGTPTSEMIKQFTLVLKGHISVARARFPKGTRGYQIDSLARQHLWAEGFDYDHGTGHGVGHFLSVHEGPASISKKQIDVALEKGMVLSNEPGYYRTDGFGIRIENLELVVEKETKGDFSVLTFESLTRCPIDTRNIDVNLLTKPELSWLNDYHEKVWNEISPHVKAEVKTWLRNATLPLSHS